MGTPNFQASNLSVKILGTASLSASSGLLAGAARLIGIQTDAAWDTQAISFQVSLDGLTWVELWNDNYGTAGAYTLAAVTASLYIAVNPVPFFGARYIKVRSGLVGAAAAQGDDTTVTLITSPI